MESNLPDGDLELSELPKGRKMSENGYLSQEQIIDSSSDVQFATLPNDMDSYESTTDPSGVNQVQTLPAPSRRVSGILKNGSSFPRDVQLQDENQIQNPLFGSPMLSDQNQRTILNVEPESASNNHHSSVLTSEDTPTLKKKVSFQDNLVITSEESNYVSAVDILSPSNLEHIEEETDGSSEEDEVPTPHDNETAVAIAEDNTMEGTYDTLQSSKSTLSKGEVLTSRNSVELFQGRYNVDELEFRNRRSRTYSEAEVPTASTGHPLYSTGKKPGRDFRCLMCMTVSMVAIAFIGLLILGSLYGISFSGDQSTVVNIAALKVALDMNTVNNSVFEDFSDDEMPLISSNDDGSLTLLTSKHGFMSWRSFESDVHLSWHGGSAIEVLSLTWDGGLSTRLAGNPVDTETAKLSILLPTNSWHSARVLNRRPSCVFKLLPHIGSRVEWTTVSDAFLLSEFGSLASIITLYAS